MRAIISVADRKGLTELASELQTYTVSIFATSDILHELQAAHISGAPVSELIQVPEISGISAEMPHLAILGGMIAQWTRPGHRSPTPQAPPVDIVVANLLSLPTAETSQATLLSEVQEQIDIERVTLIRAAAKSFQDVIVLVRPQDYVPVLQEWREQGEVSLETRRRLAAIAFQHTALYDTQLAEYMRTGSGDLFPEELSLPLKRVQLLRYGENPHQLAAFYRWAPLCHGAALSTVADAEVLHGKELSFNNILDLDAALRTVQSFTAPAVAIIKHTNPCGLACDDSLVEAYKRAHAGDPVSAYGGIIGCNRPLDEATAQEISQLFYEAVIAPEFTPAALAILSRKRNIRLLATHRQIEPKGINTQALHMGRPDVRSVSGGLLLQTPDAMGERETEYTVVTEREPTLEEVTDLMFAWKAVRHVKSNAIVLAHKLMLVGVGAGQMNRVTSVQIAVEKAAERARGAVLASDAFFPFADSVEAAAKAGVTAVVQPGGSVRDEETIRAANHYAMAMIFTGKRHFRH